MWTKFSRLGSLTLISIALFGCNLKRTEWIQTGTWVYQNKSAHTLEIKGGITHFTVTNPPQEEFTLKPDDSYSLEYSIDSDKHAHPDICINPFDTLKNLQDRKVLIIIDKDKTFDIKKGIGIRDRNNYKVEKVSSHHFRFTYIFTDEIVKELIKEQTP